MTSDDTSNEGVSASTDGRPMRQESIASNENLQQQLQQSVVELRTHEIELKLQNEELCCVQQQLERSQQDFLNLFMLAPVPYFILNAAG